MWFYHVSFVVITCIFFALSFFLGLHVLYHFLMQLSSSLSSHLLSSPSFSFFFGLFSSIFLLLLCFSFLTCFLSFLLFFFPSPTFLYFPPSCPLLSRLPLFSSPFLLSSPPLFFFFFISFPPLFSSSLLSFSSCLFRFLSSGLWDTRNSGVQPGSPWRIIPGQTLLCAMLGPPPNQRPGEGWVPSSPQTHALQLVSQAR